jgi:hypothetical protein
VINRDKQTFVAAMELAAANKMSLVLIGGGKFDDAITVLQASHSGDLAHKLRTKFNLAMAIWGLDRKPPAKLFSECLKFHEELGGQEKGANYYQCIGLALALVERKEAALEMLNKARGLVERQRNSFSCWSYLERGALGFAQDIDEMLSWSTTGAPAPSVFLENNGSDMESVG